MLEGRAILIILVIFLTIGCIGSEDPNEKMINEIESQLEAGMGTRETFDIDMDGVDDKYVLTYEPEEVAENLFLKKKVEYEDTGEGFDGTITIEFDNKGDIDYFTYRVIIPKDFAVSVNDLEFSKQPDRVINPDPEVEYDFKFEKDLAIVGIIIKAQGKEPVEDVFDKFDKAKSFSICEKMPEGGYRELCYTSAVANLKDPKPADCDILTSTASKESCYSGVAVIKNDIKMCEDFIKDSNSRALCYMQFAIFSKDKSICQKISEKAERTICELIFEAKEKGMSFDDLYKEKLNALGNNEPDQSENIYLDIMVSPNDDPKVTGRTYTFDATLDPTDQIPKSPRYEFIFSDSYSRNSSGPRIERMLQNPGSYHYTITLYNLSSGKVVARKTKTIEVEKSEEEEVETITGLTAEQCIEKGDQCAEECTKIHEQEKYDYCQEFGYSGCALDVFGWCNACGIYVPKWCIYPEYISCAESAMTTYRGCIDGCNAKVRAGQDVSTCWNDCNEVLSNQLGNPCKDGPCLDFCQDKDFKFGVWAKYTNEYGWDSCYCSNAE